MLCAHPYTVLERLKGPLHVHRRDAFMEALRALPDRWDARLTVSRAGEDTPELGQAPHHLAKRRRHLWRGLVMWHGLNGVPCVGFTHHCTGHLGIDPASHGDMVDPPGDDPIHGHGVP
jgi:hypothetical protein